MKKNKLVVILTLSAFFLVSMSCPILRSSAPDEPHDMQIIDLPEPTPTHTLEPVEDEQVFGEQETSIYRANHGRTGVYQSPGPKTSPNLSWKFNTEGTLINSTPAIYNGIVYFGGEKGLFAVNSQSGQLLWLYGTNDSVQSSPSISEGLVYFGSTDGTFHAVDMKSGEARWTFSTNGSIYSSPIIHEGRAYFGGDDGFFYALTSDAGQLLWQFEVDGVIDPEMGMYPAIRSSAALFDRSLLFGNTQIGGASADLVFYALDKDTGELQWTYPTWNSLTAPAASDGVVFFGTFMTFLGLDIEGGSPVTEFNTNWGISPPAIMDGIAVFGSENGQLFALDLQTGKEKWVFDTGLFTSITYAPSISDGTVYFGCDDGVIYALDFERGDLLWEYDTGAFVSTSPVIAAGVVYIGNSEGFLFALE